jgi:hypothetical protein
MVYGVRNRFALAQEEENWMPGMGFILTSALLGTIIARNRGWVSRTVTPLAFTTLSAYVCYPKTMDRLWKDIQSTDVYPSTLYRQTKF